MNISAIYLENFKQFDKFEIAVRNTITKDIAKRFLLLGDNGTGKTTILQAIALTLSRACYVTPNLESFQWIGWLANRYRRWGIPKIELTIHFSSEEIQATQDIARRWYDSLSLEQRKTLYHEPADSEEITLCLSGESLTTNNPNEIYQFRGRSYAGHLINQGNYEAGTFFEKLPGIFWFDQFRNLTTVQESPFWESNNQTERLPYEESSFANNENDRGRASYRLGVSQLRNILNTWLWTQLYPRGGKSTDYYGKLEKLYQKIFPTRSFIGPEPMYERGIPTPSSNYFMLSDGKRTYDIQEMSSGEQIIFPILFEFVRYQIDHSVILIDEIDLNLHPPLASMPLS